MIEIGRRIIQAISETSTSPPRNEEEFDVCKDPSKTPKLTSYNGRHTISPGKDWDKVRESTRNGGRAKYLSGMTPDPTVHQAFEQGVWAQGRVIKNTKSETWKVLEISYSIGAADGSDTWCAIVKCSAGEIHGYPAPPAECKKPSVSYP